MTPKDDTIQKQSAAIKELNKQVRDLKKELQAVREESNSAAEELKRCVDAIVAECAVKYGQAVFDDAPGIPEYPKPIGWRLDIPIPKVGKYSVMIDRADAYRIGVQLNDEVQE